MTNKTRRDEADRATRAARDVAALGAPALLYAAGRKWERPIAKAVASSMPSGEPRENLAALKARLGTKLTNFMARHGVADIVAHPDAGRGRFHAPTRVVQMPASDAEPSALLHELGHASSGQRGQGLPPSVVLGINRAAYYAPHVQGALATGANAALHFANTPADVERVMRANRNAGLLVGLIGSGRAIEETRAWLRAHKIGKELGVPLNRRRALLAVASEFSGPALSALPAVFTHIRAKRKLRELNEAQRHLGR